MDILEQLINNFNTVAENTTKVFQAGYEKGKAEGGSTEGTYEDGYSSAMVELCNTIQKDGNLTSYNYAFQNWNLNWLKYLKYKDLSSIKYFTSCFQNTIGKIDLTQFFEENGIIFNTSNATSLMQAFQGSEVVRIPTINTRKASSLTQIFFSCPNLITVDKLILKDDGSQSVTNFINNCPKLENITIEGVIGGAFNTNATRLSRDSILSILQSLQVTGKTVRIGLSKFCIDGTVDTLTTIQNDTELNTAYTTAISNGYTIAFA